MAWGTISVDHARNVRCLQRLQGQPFAVCDDLMVLGGTTSIRELLTETRVGSRAFGPGHVHRGFWDLYQDAAPSLLAASYASPVKTLVGYSLGGALAVMLAHELEFQGRPPKLVVTYGAPRVGSRAFATAPHAWKAVRVHNVADPIPLLPPRCYHVGNPLSLDVRHGSTPLDNHSLEAYQCGLARHQC